MLEEAILRIHYISYYVISPSSSCLVPEELKFHYTAAKTDTLRNAENIFLCIIKVIEKIQKANLYQ
jgi:hypothetical protein